MEPDSRALHERHGITVVQPRSVPVESTDAYFQPLRGYLQDYGCPVAFYSDKHSLSSA